ncbi:MAG: hypothetical protein RQ826_15775 [Xanthomonadales bacterium]|nr:hypothetical protein [Xanthomonadales bacterium]
MTKLLTCVFVMAAGAGILQTAIAMCAATTQNLVRLEVSACQQVKIRASDSPPAAHRMHRRGSCITGAMVTGRVISSTLVWDGDPGRAEYLVTGGKLPTDAFGTFFLGANASKTCPTLLGTEATLVTNRPCCDMLPADGLCLVPAAIPIAQVEKQPERWIEWVPRH